MLLSCSVTLGVVGFLLFCMAQLSSQLTGRWRNYWLLFKSMCGFWNFIKCINLYQGYLSTIPFFYFKHAPVSAKHFYSTFKASVCYFLWPYFLFYRHDSHCVSYKSAETRLGNVQGIKPENPLIRCRWSTKQQQTLYTVDFPPILMRDHKHCLNWVI